MTTELEYVLPHRLHEARGFQDRVMRVLGLPMHSTIITTIPGSHLLQAYSIGWIGGQKTGSLSDRIGPAKALELLNYPNPPIGILRFTPVAGPLTLGWKGGVSIRLSEIQELTSASSGQDEILDQFIALLGVKCILDPTLKIHPKTETSAESTVLYFECSDPTELLGFFQEHMLLASEAPTDQETEQPPVLWIPNTSHPIGFTAII